MAMSLEGKVQNYALGLPLSYTKNDVTVTFTRYLKQIGGDATKAFKALIVLAGTSN